MFSALTRIPPYCNDNEADKRERYQIGGHRLLSGKEMCGMIAVQVQIIWRANLIPSGPRAAVTIHAASRRVRACRPMVYGFKARTTARPRRPGDGRWEMASCWAAAVRFENFKQKARDGFLRAGFMIFAMSFCQ